MSIRMKKYSVEFVRPYYNRLTLPFYAVTITIWAENMESALQTVQKESADLLDAGYEIGMVRWDRDDVNKKVKEHKNNGKRTEQQQRDAEDQGRRAEEIPC